MSDAVIEYPYFRQEPQMPVGELVEKFSSPRTVVVCDTTEVVVTEDTIRFPKKGTRQKVDGEAPLRGDLAGNWATWLEAPAPFINKIGAYPDFRATVLNGLAERKEGQVALSLDKKSGEVVEIYDPNSLRYQPSALCEIAGNVMPEGSQVVEVVNTPNLFQFDVVVPIDAKHGVGGDKPKAKQVGDITRGGLRFRMKQSQKQNHVPSVSQFLFRLACTNGMECQPHIETIDGRGPSIDEVMADIERQANILFERLDKQIEEFYALRDAPLGSAPTDILRRTARENKLPIHGTDLESMMDLILTVPEPTQFDMVNIFTNYANRPELTNKHVQRRTLEVAGGDLVHEHHVARCSQCHTRMGPN